MENGKASAASARIFAWPFHAKATLKQLEMKQKLFTIAFFAIILQQIALAQCEDIPTLACGAPTSVTLSGFGSWNMSGAFPNNSCGFSTQGQEQIYSFTPTTTGVHALQVTSTTGLFFDYFYKVASGGCNNTGWTCISDISEAITVPIGTLTAGVQYYILVDAEPVGSNTQTFQINCPAPSCVAAPASPTDGQVVCPSATTTLSWPTVAGATSYDVHFGTSNPPPYVANTPNTTYAASTSTPGTYYWQIIPKNAEGSASGCAVWSFSVANTVVYVNADATGANNGSSWANAFTDLQSALAVACSGAEIWVAAGTYKPTTGTDRNISFSMKNGMAIFGGFNGTETQLSERDWVNNVTILSGDIGTIGNNADNSYHVIFNNNNGLDGTAVLDGFTISAGNADRLIAPRERGGGMYNNNSSPMVSNCTFQHNAANSFGGGMYNDNASPSLTNCTFSENTANYSSGDGDGGGMYNNNSNPILANCTFTGNNSDQGGGMHNFASNPNLSNCSFSANHSKIGGGIYNVGSAPILTNCTFSNNMATGNAGGMYNVSSNPILTNCTFAGNTAFDGGGIFNSISAPSFVNCIFSGNTAGNNGGGLFNANSNHSLFNCTLSGNTAGTSGGGLHNFNFSPSLTNCLVWNNRANGVTGSADANMSNEGATPVISYSLLQGHNPGGTGNLDGIANAANPNYPQFVTPLDPATAPSTGGNFRLQACSSAIDAGTNTGAPNNDLDGNARPYNNGTVDMGAFEYQGTANLCLCTDLLTWTGALSTDWHTADNWNPACVPTSGHHVLIPDVVNNPTISTTALAKSVIINNGAVLTVSATGSLAIDGFTTYFGFTTALGNEGAIENSGAITIGANAGAGNYGIHNRATFNNNLGGQISIDRSTITGIYNANGTFTNAAKITIGAVASVGSDGIRNEATFNNSTCTALIRIASNAIVNNTGTFTNAGSIIENANFNSGTSSITSNSGIVQNLNGGTFTVGSGNPAITTTGNIWTGCTSTDWAAAGNWLDGTVPTTSDNVTIPNVTNDPVIMGGTAALANSVHVQASAALTINATGSLTINGSATFGGITAGFYNQGTVSNTGNLILGSTASVGFYGIRNDATFDNNNNGEISIDRSTAIGLYNFSGTFTNAAKITIGAVAGVGFYGIRNVATFNNSASGGSGEISIDSSSNIGLYNDFGGTFTNAAKITIGAVASVGNYGIVNYAMFNNNPASGGSGEISIDRSSSRGLWNGAGTFTNAAKITIGSTAGVGTEGIFTSATFNNNIGGDIRIDRSSSRGLYSSGTFTNAAKITIGALASVGNYGIYNQSTFNNSGGEISIDRSSDSGLFNFYGTFTNAAKITIGAVASVGTEGIRNQVTFNNSTCTALVRIVSDAVVNNTGTFTNAGGIIENASGNSSITTNTGVIQNLNGGTFTTGGTPATTFAGHLSACCPAANILYVNDDATGNNDGTSWADAYTDLQSALNSTCPGVTEIWVAAGTYKPTTGTDRSISFSMKNGVAIYGGFNGTETQLSERDWVANETTLSGDIGAGGNADNSYHVIFNNNNGLTNTAVLDGFTITSGNANGSSPDDSGGGILNTNGFPKFSNCIFTGNSANVNGGGISNNTSSSPVITNCAFIGNTAGQFGGAVFNIHSSLPSLTNCTISENTSMGAIASFNSSFPTITNCIIWNNPGGNIIHSVSSGTNVSYSIVEGGYSGTANINANPLFVNAAGGDFHLQDCSLAIDAGTNTGAPTTDLDGNARPFNATGLNRVDIGAYEAQTVLPGVPMQFGNNVWNVYVWRSGGATLPNANAWSAGYAGYYVDNSLNINTEAKWPAAGSPSQANDYQGCTVADDDHSYSYKRKGFPASSYQLNVDNHDDSAELWINGTKVWEHSDCCDAHANVWSGTLGTMDEVEFRVTEGGWGSVGKLNFIQCPSGNVVYVNANATGANNGASWTDAYTDLQSALNSTCPGVTEIWVAAGTYKPTTGTDRNISFSMKNGVAIFGGFNGTETQLSDRNWATNVTILSGDIGAAGKGDNSYHVIFNNNNGLNNTAVLDGFSITGGNADHPTAPNDSGGGMFNSSSSPTVANCTFHDNSAFKYGGGMYNNSSNSSLTNCIFSGNTAGDKGGGIFNIYSNSNLTNCTISGNAAGSIGGGINNVNLNPILTNCLLWNNRANGVTSSADASLANGIATPNINYSLIQGRNPGGTGNLDGIANAADANYPQFVTPLDPATAPSTGGDFHLQTCSPAIDAGSNAAVPGDITTDLDGNPRIFNSGTVDMGAYEFQDEPDPCLCADIRTWTGALSTDWHTADNWNPACVPTSDNHVLIPDVANDPAISTTALAKSVIVNNGAVLTVSATGSLAIDGFTTYFGFTTALGNEGVIENSGAITIGANAGACNRGIHNRATFNNNTGGQVSVDNTDFTGIYNFSGAFTNAATITIGANAMVGTYGIWSEATFFNNPGGQISIDRSNYAGISNGTNSTFNNAAEITIGANAGVGSYGIQNRATFNNNSGGQISVDRSTSTGIENISGAITNVAEITIGANASVGAHGIQNRATFNNNSGGQISVDKSIAVGIENISGAFNNMAAITIGANTGVGSYGIQNRATFNNNSGGQIRVDKSFKTGIENISGAFNNAAAITIGANAGVRSYGIQNRAAFNNNPGGQISLDNLTYAGIENPLGGTFNNASAITIGANAGVGLYGIQNLAAFNNNTGGQIRVDRSTHAGIYNQSSIFTNEAVITIGANAGVGFYGIQNLASFNNSPGGQVSVDRSNNSGIYNLDGTFNNAASITIGAETSVGAEGIRNNAAFINSACAVLTNFAPVVNWNTFTNAGLFTSSTTGSHTNNSTLTNNGIIAYPQGNPIPNVTNNEIIIAPTTSSNCQSVSPAFALGNPVDFTIQGIYSDANATLSAGTFDQGANTFTPSPALSDDEMYNYYVKIEDGIGGCTRTVPWQVTVHDDTPPTAGCQDITVSLDGNGNAAILPADVFDGGTDNCGTANPQNVSPDEFSCAHLGANTVTLTVSDGNGNTNTCTATLTVQDDTPPTATCQDITVSLDGNGNTAILPADVFDGGTDNCGTASPQNVSPDEFSCAHLGANTVTLTVSDGNGNTNTCTATVTVQDDTPPTAGCQDITVSLDGNGNAAILPADVFDGGTDNCGTAIPQNVSPDDFTCAHLGANTVTLTVSDGNGNNNTCTATVTVLDDTPPTAGCQDITVSLGGNGGASILPADVFDGGTDNCGTANPQNVSPDEFSCAHLGANTVTLTVSDGNGNTNTCTATVTVQDDTPPTATCQDITISLDGAGNVSILPADVFDGGTDNCGTASPLSVSLDAFTCAHLGENEVTLTVSDGNGNNNTCTATVTVQDDTPPTATCQDITVSLDGNGNATILPADVFDGGTDNCGPANPQNVSLDAFTCAPRGRGDAVGNRRQRQQQHLHSHRDGAGRHPADRHLPTSRSASTATATRPFCPPTCLMAARTTAARQTRKTYHLTRFPAHTSGKTR
jgi:hypothetical protein